MYRKEVNEHSPMRILDRSIHGGLGPGNLGVVMARAGAGKTAILVQIGLDDLMRDRQVLHVALGQSLEHVHTWYDALFDDLAALYQLDDREAERSELGKHRVIQSFADHNMNAERLEKILSLYSTHMNFKPSAILIDGYDWEGNSTKKAAELGALKNIAKRLGAELWITAQTHRSVSGAHPTKIVGPCEAYQDLIDVAIFLEPHGTHCTVRLLKDHADAVPPDTHLVLDCNTLRIAEEDAGVTLEFRLPATAYTLLSGGANGAEDAFGACAERWGLHEVNYSFAGRTTARKRGLVELGDNELKQGGVSATYVEAQLHRKFPNTPIFQKTLQSIWHQVATAGEVFVVGTILPDGTVKGGTGWAAELARHFNKKLHVYDQEKKQWMAWRNRTWTPVDPPMITTTRFTGTGTRTLSDEGRAAIQSLFEKTFGPAPRRPSNV